MPRSSASKFHSPNVLAAARAEIDHARTAPARLRRRLELAAAIRLAAAINKSQHLRTRFENSADRRGTRAARGGASPHLRLLRYLRIKTTRPSRKRHSDLIVLALQSSISAKEIAQAVVDIGPTRVLELLNRGRRPVRRLKKGT